MNRSLRLLSSTLVFSLSLLAAGAASAQAPTRIGGRVIDRGDGSLVMVTRATNNSVLFGQKTALDRVGWGGWDAWYGLDGVVSSQPVALLNANGTVIVFGRGTDARIYYRQETAAGSKSFKWWEVIEQYDARHVSVPAFVGNPALARLGDGKLTVFSTSSDGAVWQSTQTASAGAWGAWASLGKPSNKRLIGSPVVALNANGALSVFGRDSDGAIWLSQQASAGGAWGAWASMGGKTNTEDALAVAPNTNGRLTLILNNSAATVSFRTQTSASSTTWTAWANLLGGAHGFTRPAVTRHADGRLVVFFHADAGGHELDFQSQTSPGAATWNNWTFYTDVGSPPVAFTDKNGIIHVFALDSSGYIHEGMQTARNANTFTSWVDGYFGGPLAGM